jgi:predicted Zn-dependent protease
MPKPEGFSSRRIGIHWHNMEATSDFVIYEDQAWQAPAESLVRLGEVWERKNRQRSESLYKAAVSLDPSLPIGWYRLGKVLLELGNLPDAARALHRANDLLPFHGATIHALCKAYWAMGDTEMAARQAQRFLSEGLRHSGVEKVFRDCQNAAGEEAARPAL